MNHHFSRPDAKISVGTTTQCMSCLHKDTDVNRLQPLTNESVTSIKSYVIIYNHKKFSQKRSAQCALWVITGMFIRNGASAGECVCDFNFRQHTPHIYSLTSFSPSGGGGGLLVPGLPRADVRVHGGGGGRVLPPLRCRPLPG